MGGEERRLGCPCRSVRADESGRRRERNRVSATQRVRKEEKEESVHCSENEREEQSVHDAGSEEGGGRKGMSAVQRVKREERWTRVSVTLRMGGEKRRLGCQCSREYPLC
eukprot:3678992-Rhodomonas_salina.4